MGKGNPSGASEETHHIGAARKYRDVIRYRSHVYLGHPVRSGDDIALGSFVTRIRQSLAVSDTGDPYQHPELADDGATLLAVGTPVLEVIGYSPDSRLGAYLAGRLHIYIAKATDIHVPARNLPRAAARLGARNSHEKRATSSS
jgi:hypothetical protein